MKGFILFILVSAAFNWTLGHSKIAISSSGENERKKKVKIASERNRSPLSTMEGIIE